MWASAMPVRPLTVCWTCVQGKKKLSDPRKQMGGLAGAAAAAAAARAR